MGLLSWFKQWFVCHLLLGYVYITSGLILNLLMLALTVIWPFNRNLYRRCIDRLAYALWSELVFVTKYWSGSQCDLVSDDPELLRLGGKENALIILNHKYDIDWLMGYTVCDRMKILGNSKVYCKDTLRYVPIVGWTFYFTETIFVARNWRTDSTTIPQCIARYKEYPSDLPFWILLFPEGTRFTEKKREASNAVAREKGLPELKHHLLPRTKGFVESMRSLKGLVPVIYDCVVGFTEDSAQPTLMSILNGRPCHAQIKVRRIPLDEVPTETDEACGNWLHELFRQKDQEYEYFHQHGQFRGQLSPVPHHHQSAVIFLFWVLALVIPVLWYLGSVLATGSWLLQLSALSILAALSIAFKALVSVTEIEKGSTYGKTNGVKAQ